jgi:hypothetical protein
MAQVKINVPGIGDIVADGVASEETLNKILLAIAKTKKERDAVEKRAAAELAKAKKEEKETVEDTTSELDKLIKAASGSSKSLDKSSKDVNEFGKKLKDGFTATVASFAGTLVGLGAGVTAVAAKLATAYDSMADNPISSGKQLINDGIALLTVSAKGAADAVGTVGKMFGGIPVIGPVIEGVTAGLSTVAKAAIDLASSLARTFNEVMAKEFEKTKQSFDSLNKAGASFSGGMDEIRLIASESGVAMTTLTKSAVSSAENFRAAGLSQGDGVKLLSKSMNATAKEIGKSGHSLRDEMLALGYSYEEQGQIQALYAAQLRASGVDLKNLAPAELAQRSRDYAENLKVISDITGQDAKKLAEKARTESMRGSVMAKMDEKQRDSFSKAYSLMAKYGPEVQNALVQQLAGGVITDQKIAANADLVNMIQSVAGDVSTANENITDATLQAMATARARIMSSDIFKATDIVGLLAPGANALAEGMSKIMNEVVASGFTMDQATASQEAAKKMGESITGTSESFVNITNSAQTFARQMEEMTGQQLPLYTGQMATAFEKAVDAFNEGVEVIKKGPKAYANDKINQTLGGRSLDERINAASIDALAGAAMGSVAGPVGAAVGGALGATYGMFKEELAEGTEKSINWLSKQWGSMWGDQTGKATGGISSGPTSGYLEKLHGTEAIVPLSGGRSIPVDLNFENFSQLMSPNQDVVSDVSKNITSGTFDLVEMLSPKISSMRDIGTAMNSVIAEVSKLSQSDPGPQSEIASAITSITELLGSKQEIKQSVSEMSSVIEILNKMAESHEKSNQYLEDQVTALRQLYNAMA